MNLPILAPPQGAHLVVPTDYKAVAQRIARLCDAALAHHRNFKELNAQRKGLGRRCVVEVIAAGTLFLEAKELAGRNWMAWVRDNLPVSHRTVTRYCTVARWQHLPEIGHVSSFRKAYRIAQAAEQAEKRKEQRGNPPAPNGRYSVIVADPPWPLDEGGTTLDYDTLSIPKICDFKVGARPVRDLADDNSVLWLWTVQRYLREAFDVLEAWGFKYAAREVVWVKDIPGLHPWLPSRHESLIIGTRGSPILHPVGRSTVFEAARAGHSVKPDELFKLVEEVCPSHPLSRLELFARSHRPGWVCTGDQLLADDGAQPGADVLPQRAAAQREE